MISIADKNFGNKNVSGIVFMFIGVEGEETLAKIFESLLNFWWVLPASKYNMCKWKHWKQSTWWLYAYFNSSVEKKAVSCDVFVFKFCYRFN